MSFWADHGTKILGSVQLGVGFAVSSVSMLQPAMSPAVYIWVSFSLGLINAAVGGATIKRGFTNSNNP